MTEYPLPPLTWLRAFEATARHLSFTLAAAELGLTQSAISQHVRHLESYLGQDLFLRKTRAIALTEAGSNYLPTIREAFELLASGTRAFTGDAKGKAVTVQSNLAFATFWLAPRLRRLSEAHPWINLHLVTPIWDPERSSATAEIEIRFGRGAELSPTAVRLSDDQCYPVCHPEFALGRPDWRSAPLYDCAGITGNWQVWLNSQGLRLPRDKAINLASTYVISLNVALGQGGLAMGHDTLVAGLLREGRLIRPFRHSFPLTEGYYLLPPARHHETPATRAFRDWLDGEIASGL